MRSAETMRKISTEFLGRKASIQIRDIQQRIQDAAMDGNFEINVWYTLAKEVTDGLKELGYRITYHCSSSVEDPYTTISWR